MNPVSPVNVSVVWGSDRPVVLTPYRGPVLALSVEEVEELIDNLRDAIGEAESVVQVRLISNNPSSPPTWAYLDPSSELEVGDIVQVPFGPTNKPVIGIVTGLGRSRYDGPLKSVEAKLLKREL